jgi:CubicO group peptidase (beta-lactamase class C family)
MMRPIRRAFAIAVLCVAALLPVDSSAAGAGKASIETFVTRAIRPVMERYGVPGMAVGIIVKGQTYVYDYGVASTATGRPVTSSTLFEIGSVSKTFTATLAAFARTGGALSLSDMASEHLRSLRGSSFDEVSLLDLGTHMSGLPLQVPDNITNNAQLMEYLRSWKPEHAPGTYRTYSNLGIGLLGMIAASSMHGDFVALMQERVFSGLGMQHTYFDVPVSEWDDYAQGYTATNIPIRMVPGVLAPEAYGIKTTAGDMLRFIAANMGMLDINERLQHAIAGTHAGYDRIGSMTQDLIWEQYDDRVGLKELREGNSDRMLLQANPATRLDPAAPPRDHVLIDKTGSTNGFSTYVAFIPAKKTGIVILANKRYPNDARVTAAYAILTRLDDDASKD